jgi:Co/Zn/Cd efflux system component/predicted transcriptional regulator
MKIGDKKMRERGHRHGNFHEFILMALLKGGPLSLRELKGKAVLFASQFGYQRLREYGEQVDLKLECNSMVSRGMLHLNKDDKYELTPKGKKEAIKKAKGMEQAANLIKAQLFAPTATARNTLIANLLLAIMKLLSGFLSGSVGLIADGADAAIDTASSAIVWIGLKFKKEFLGTLVIVLMMFITAVSVGYESIMKITQAIISTLSPITMPYLVIGIESIALIAALILYFYQRYVGKRNGSLALISQSIDSKNHIYVAGAVIAGAIFSIFGIHFVDALIGTFIAIRILIDGIELSKEALSAMRGRESDFSKYRIPFENYWHLNKLETFRIWVLYSMREDNLRTRDEMVNLLENTFGSGYIPILSEFKFGIGGGFDFKEEFDNLIHPLLDKGLLIKEDKIFILTEDGKKHVDKIFKGIRYHIRE